MPAVAVAVAAGVALVTVHLAFDTRSGLLRALWHLLLRGDEGDPPMTERPWFLAVPAEPDPAERLAMLARTGVQVKLRAAAPMEVIRTAVGPLTEAGDLRPGLDVETATDLLWTYHHPDVWRALVVACGWTPDRYREWLVQATRRDLLGRA